MVLQQSPPFGIGYGKFQPFSSFRIGRAERQTCIGNI